MCLLFWSWKYCLFINCVFFSARRWFITQTNFSTISFVSFCQYLLFYMYYQNELDFWIQFPLSPFDIDLFKKYLVGTYGIGDRGLQVMNIILYFSVFALDELWVCKILNLDHLAILHITLKKCDGTDQCGRFSTKTGGFEPSFWWRNIAIDNFGSSCQLEIFLKMSSTS